GEVVDGDDRGAGAGKRERVLEVGQAGPEPSQRARHRRRHAQRLRAGPNLHRLDALRNEVWPARDRSKTEIAPGELRQAAQQVLAVRLAARPLAPEDVRVQDHERGHAAASRYTTAVARATSAQLNARARSRPRRTSSARRRSASSMPAAI